MYLTVRGEVGATEMNDNEIRKIKDDIYKLHIK